jgi:hypothetical protein
MIKRRTITERNARFWVFVNDGWVRLSLGVGQYLTHSVGGPDEEGFSYTHTRWARYGHGREEFIEQSVATNARDCDGPLDTYWVGECRVDALEDHPSFDNAVPVPNWEKVSASQRDHFAEVAGY